MRRTSLVAVALVAAATLALASGAAAKPTVKTCAATLPSVAGNPIEGTLTSRNVNSIQARFATCAHAKEVMKKTTELRVEEPRSTKAYYCVPKVFSTSPDVVKYTCTFKSADTPMFAKLVFKVKYDLD